MPDLVASLNHYKQKHTKLRKRKLVFIKNSPSNSSKLNYATKKRGEVVQSSGYMIEKELIVPSKKNLKKKKGLTDLEGNSSIGS